MKAKIISLCTTLLIATAMWTNAGENTKQTSPEFEG
jgi:hypothetical protein